MHLNPYGEYAVRLAASLANDWPDTRAGIIERTREFGMSMEFPVRPEDHPRTRQVIDDWLDVVDAPTPNDRAALLNVHMAEATAYPRLTDHDGEGWHLHYRDDDQALPSVLRAAPWPVVLRVTTPSARSRSPMTTSASRPTQIGRASCRERV